MGTLFSVDVELPDEDSTISHGASFSKIVTPGMRIYLRGDLGAGKTAFVRSVLRALGVTGPIKSPTYNLIEVYVVSRLNLYHFDFYRFDNENEWEEAGFREMLSDTNVCFVEWPENAGTTLPVPDIEIQLTVKGEGRMMTLSALTPLGERQLQQFYDTIR